MCCWAGRGRAGVCVPSAQEYISQQFPDACVSFRGDILARIKEQILDTLLSVRSTIDTNNKGRRCFELFGYDFMVGCRARAPRLAYSTCRDDGFYRATRCALLWGGGTPSARVAYCAWLLSVSSWMRTYGRGLSK